MIKPIENSLTSLSEHAAGREKRRQALLSLSPLGLANLILDYQLLLTEECDPIETILNHEFQPNFAPVNRTSRL